MRQAAQGLSVNILCGFLLVLGASAAWAGEFKSTAGLTVFYDAPSVKSEKIFVANEGYPLEVIVTLPGMYKVRDLSGKLAWVEQRSLEDKRMLIVQTALAEIRSKPDEAAPVLFQAEQNVVLELLEPPESGWVKVKHQEGQSGYIRIQQIWGL